MYKEISLHNGGTLKWARIVAGKRDPLYEIVNFESYVMDDDSLRLFVGDYMIMFIEINRYDHVIDFIKEGQ